MAGGLRRVDAHPELHDPQPGEGAPSVDPDHPGVEAWGATRQQIGTSRLCGMARSTRPQPARCVRARTRTTGSTFPAEGASTRQGGSDPGPEAPSHGSCAGRRRMRRWGCRRRHSYDPPDRKYHLRRGGSRNFHDRSGGKHHLHCRNGAVVTGGCPGCARWPRRPVRDGRGGGRSGPGRRRVRRLGGRLGCGRVDQPTARLIRNLLDLGHHREEETPAPGKVLRKEDHDRPVRRTGSAPGRRRSRPLDAAPRTHATGPGPTSEPPQASPGTLRPRHRRDKAGSRRGAGPSPSSPITCT